MARLDMVKELERALIDAQAELRRLGDLLTQVDRQSRCRHVWETAETPSKRRCAECGCEPLKR